jgi:hypothetical protein
MVQSPSREDKSGSASTGIPFRHGIVKLSTTAPRPCVTFRNLLISTVRVAWAHLQHKLENRRLSAVRNY